MLVSHPHLNTSHVKVNHMKMKCMSHIQNNLNTSHVKVNRVLCSCKNAKAKFKYISC